MTTSIQTLRLIGYLMLSLLFGIVITAAIGSYGNGVVEKNVRKDTENQIRNAVKSFEDASHREAPDEVIEYLREYLNTVMKDVAVGVEPGHGATKPSREEALFLFSFIKYNWKMDIYIKKSFLKDEMFELDKPLLIEGVVATLVMFTLLVVFLEQRRQTQLKHQTEKAALNQELEEQHALALLGRMSATLAHELKTPVATLSNLVYALPSRISDTHFTDRFVVLAKEELGRTQQLIDNLLSYGKDITLTAEEWIPLDDFSKELSQKADLHLDCPAASIYGDRFYLGLLFENLLNNSIQAEAKKVVLTAGRKKGMAVINYVDDGVGFPRDVNVNELAKPFVTFRSRGAGLGLHLVQKILTAHGGGFSLYRARRGAVLKLTLPPERLRINDNRA